MKNIITILLILILPVCIYLIMSKNSSNIIAIAKENTPSLYIFTSTMCMDCQKMKKVIKEIEPNYHDRINFIQINAIDKNRKVQEYIKKYGVTLVPTIVVLDKNNNKINHIEGYVEKEKLVEKIEEAING